MNALRKSVPEGIKIVPQGEYVAASLEDYLNRHKEMDERCSKNGEIAYYTTENPERFKECAAMFLHEDVNVKRVEL